MTHTAASCDLLHDSDCDVTDLIRVTPGIGEVLCLLELAHGPSYRMTRALQRQVRAIQARLEEARGMKGEVA